MVTGINPDTMKHNIRTSQEPGNYCGVFWERTTTGCGPRSNSDLGMSRSSIFRMGKMGGGGEIHPPGPTSFRSGRTRGPQSVEREVET